MGFDDGKQVIGQSGFTISSLYKIDELVKEKIELDFKLIPFYEINLTAKIKMYFGHY